MSEGAGLSVAVLPLRFHCLGLLSFESLPEVQVSCGVEVGD